MRITEPLGLNDGTLWQARLPVCGIACRDGSPKVSEQVMSLPVTCRRSSAACP
ncbi:hypothetical protein [Streptomyces sp. NPDC048282]|uniref:hypothetical protein n=1 Tax=unclassified Streptomyces TaxID=2593676 RepID=UPI003711DE21